MTDALKICRICLSVNVRIFSLKNTNMENVYKLLTQVDIHDGKPTTVCFLCYARLRQCDRLQQQAIKSNELLKQLSKGGFMATTNALLNNQYSSQDLQVSSTYYLDLEPTKCEDVLLDPKVEANSMISVKEELPIDEGYYVTENLCTIRPEEGVKNCVCPCGSSQIQQTYTNKEAKGIHIKSERNLNENKKNSFILNTNNHDSDAQITNKIQIPKSSHEEYTQNENIINIKRTVIDSLTDEFKCNEQFSPEGVLTDHILSCKETTECLPSVSPLMEANTLMSLLSEKYRCDNCAYETHHKRSMVKHLKMHSITKVFICDICMYRCAQKNELKQHMVRHTGVIPYSCYICGYRCAYKQYLKDHMIVHTGDKPFYCNICEYSCALKTRLRDHMKLHTGEKPFSCSICGYRCVFKHQLKGHMAVHTGEKPFCCNICECRYAHKYKLKDHLRTHTGEKPFSCNICEYRTTQKHHLKAHIRRHTGEKPFSCNLCEYRCAQRGHLKRHIRTHTGEKPYSCNICEYRCTKKPYLRVHLKTHK